MAIHTTKSGEGDEDIGTHDTLPMMMSAPGRGTPLDEDPGKTGPMPAISEAPTVSAHEAPATTARISLPIQEAALETPSSAIFKNENRTALLAKLGVKTKDRKIERPSEREVCYLVIDANTVNNMDAQKMLQDEVKIVADAGDFYVNEDSDGNLIIMALSERGGVEKLIDIERSLYTQLPDVKMLLNIGNVEHIKTTGQFNLKQYPEGNETAKWRKPSTVPTHKTIIKKALADKIRDPHSRIGSNLAIVTSDNHDPEDLYLLDAIQKVSEEQGGPDTLIGYEKELAALLKHVTDDETALIVLDGEAWKGKSRLRTELCKKITSKIVCSANASDANLLGSTLVSLAKQLYGSISSDTLLATIATDEIRVDDQHSSLAQFMELSHAQQITLAAKYPNMISEICSEALRKLNDKKDPNTLLIIEDLHHADRLSLPFLKEIIQNYRKQTGGKTLITKRPEETYDSKVLKDLLAETKAENGNNSVKTVSIREGLNFTRDPELAEKFAFHSLPLEKRKKADGTAKKLGDWPRKIARLSGNTPGYFKVLMDIVQEHLIYSEDTIEITDDFARELDNLRPEDLEMYLNERVKRLPPLQLTMLQCLALLGESVPPIVVILMAQKCGALDGEVTSDQIMDIYNPLIAGGYLVEKKAANETLYAFQHENMSRIVFNSIPEERKAELASITQSVIAGNPAVSPSAKHSLATFVANKYQMSEIEDEELEFWQGYTNLCNTVIDYSKSQNDSEYTYEICAKILNIPRVQSAISSLREGVLVPIPELPRLIERVLIAQADAARFLAKFEEVDALVETFSEIESKRPREFNALEMKMIAFEKAYTISRVKDMKTLADDITTQRKPSPGQIAMIEIKLALRESRFADVTRIFKIHEAELAKINIEHIEKYGTPSPIYLETLRVATLRAPHENIRSKAENRDGKVKFDSDVVRQPLALDRTQTAEMQKLDENMASFQRNARRSPLSLDRYSEFNILDQIAESTAFAGKTEEAIKLYANCWLTAKQMQLHDRAARATRLKGDLEVLKTIQGDETSIEEKIAWVKKALSTYAESGVEEEQKSFKKLDKANFYQFVIRLQRIRATAILASLYQQQDTSTEELSSYFAQAFDDVIYINENFPNYNEDPGDNYYIIGAIGNLLSEAQKIGIPSQMIEEFTDSTKYPLMSHQQILKAIEFGENNVTDLGIGEVQRKLNGLYAAVSLIEQKQAKSKKLPTENPELYELAIRLERLRSISELLKNQVKLPTEERMRPTTLQLHLETAVKDFRILGLKDVTKHLPEESYSLEEIRNAAKELGIDLKPYLTARLKAEGLEPQAASELSTINNLTSLSRHRIRTINQEKRRQRDRILFEAQQQAA